MSEGKNSVDLRERIALCNDFTPAEGRPQARHLSKILLVQE